MVLRKADIDLTGELTGDEVECVIDHHYAEPMPVQDARSFFLSFFLSFKYSPEDMFIDLRERERKT